ncbi:outer membrane protein assembly factor [Marinicauda algicola]|uniref:Outer membrane protein assembly factor n=1 Tax=Marinicauda algicola TaxID=2029849 RepID=A0A4S2H443_9PROT|nr:autotransporter assembly complex family protein [Marinicauda algicola]TGY90405.1 outer membrane protein assembly factor [Marinicauda algicola]
MLAELFRSTRARVRLAAAAMLAVCAASPDAFADPVAQIEGVEDAALREALYETIGEADAPPETRWRARERARQAAERIRLYLESRGYYAALVDARLGDDTTPLVRVRPGEPFTFGEIDVEYETPSPDTPRPGADITGELGLEAGDRLLAAEVIRAESRILQALRNSGWIHAETGAREIIVDHATQTARATFRFRTGDYVLFGPPQLAGGLANLRESYVARLAPYEVGEPASKARLDEYARRLQGLDTVSIADVRIAYDASGRQRPVDVRMEPVPRHTLALSARYSTSEGFGGETEWIRRNMFRRDETLRVNLLAATIASGIDTRLHMPHWRRYNQALTLNAEALAERTDAFDQDSIGLGASLSRVVSDALTVSAGAEARIAQIDDARGKRDLNTFSFPVEAVYDGRDSVLDPSEGLYADLRVRPGLTTGDEETRYVRMVAELRGYHDIADDIVLAARVRGGMLTGAGVEEVPADQRFFAGGGGSVRGYEYQSISPPLLNIETGEEEPFGGRSLVEASVEARWRRSERLGFVAFLDAGMAGRDISPDLSETQYAAGIGVRYFPGFGPIRADIATPLNPREGDDPVHFYISIGQAF